MRVIVRPFITMQADRHPLLSVQEGGECELELVIHHELLQPQAPEQPKALPGVSSSLPGCCCSACTSMQPSDHSSVMLGASRLVTPHAGLQLCTCRTWRFRCSRPQAWQCAW